MPVQQPDRSGNKNYFMWKAIEKSMPQSPGNPMGAWRPLNIEQPQSRPAPPAFPPRNVQGRPTRRDK